MSFSNEKEMHVTKRNNSKEVVSFDKILQRIKKIGKDVNFPCSIYNEYGSLNNINYTSLAMKVIDQLYDGITTTQIDELSSEQCASMSSVHPDYTLLASRIMISNHHKNTNNSFVKTVKKLYNNLGHKGESNPLVSNSKRRCSASSGLPIGPRTSVAPLPHSWPSILMKAMWCPVLAVCARCAGAVLELANRAVCGWFTLFATNWVSWCCCLCMPRASSIRSRPAL